VRVRREREVAKKKYDESSRRVLLLSSFSANPTRLLFHIFFPPKNFFVWLFHSLCAFHSPKVATSPSEASRTPQINSNERRAYSSTQTPLKRVSLSLSLSLIDRTKSKEGRRHRARALSLSRWRRLFGSPSPPLPRSSGVHPSRDAEEEEEEEEARRRGRRLLHRMRRRGTTRTSTRRRKRYPPPTNARINRVKVKCGGQTLPLLLLLR